MPPKKRSDYYLVKFIMDGIMAIKSEDDLEHEEVTDRAAFWVDDIVLCTWDDGEQYSAKVIASGSKKTLQAKLKELKPKRDKTTDPSKLRKMKQAKDLRREIEIDGHADDDEDLNGTVANEDITPKRTKESRDLTKLSITPKPGKEKIVEQLNTDYIDVNTEDVTHEGILKTPSPTVLKKVPLTSSSSLKEEMWKRKYKILKRKLDFDSDDCEEADSDLGDDKFQIKSSPGTSEKPQPGIITTPVAKRFKMCEIVEGSGVYWTKTHEQHVIRKSSNETQLTASCIDVFFDRDILVKSNAKGGGKGGYKALDKEIISAIQAYVLEKYSKAKPASVITTINNKCTAARRAAAQQKQ